MKDMLLKELTFTTSRSSGPGGQHVNKTESRVTLHWNLRTSEALSEEERALVGRRLSSRLTDEGELLLSSQKSRSQAMNKEEVTIRFLVLIEKASKPQKRRVRTQPSRNSVERRLKRKKIRGEKKRTRGRPDPGSV